MAEFNLVGYLRKTKSGNGLRLNLSKEALEQAGTYTTRDGKEYISILARVSSVMDVLDGVKEFTDVCYIQD